MTPKFALVLFDLDNTLVASNLLESFRGAENLGDPRSGYKDELINAIRNNQEIKPLFSENILSKIQANGLGIGIFTRSPRNYARVVVQTLYPAIAWQPEMIVAYEDVPRRKPDPMGIHKAMAYCGIKDPRTVIVVGDDSKDIKSAYNAGSIAVLCCWAWPEWPGKKREQTHWEALEFMPDAVLPTPDDLLKFIEDPDPYLPPIERIGIDGLSQYDRSGHLMKKYWPPKTPPWDRLSAVDVLSLGRYFGEKSGTRASGHAFNHRLIQFKDHPEVPAEWIPQLGKAVEYCIRGTRTPAIITVIPHKAGRLPRLEHLLAPLKEYLFGLKINVEIEAELFSFLPGAQSAAHDHLSKEERFKNLAEHLESNDEILVKNRHIVVIDDVVTSGASFIIAQYLLMNSGASRVSNISLGRTISGGTSPWLSGQAVQRLLDVARRV